MKKTGTIFGIMVTLIAILSIVLIASISIASAYTIGGDEFSNRKLITIDNTENANTLTDYQVKFDVPYEPEMQPDFDDLRFTDSSDNILNYWIEDYTPDTSATVWVKIPLIPGSETTTIYMYYGNDGVSSESDSALCPGGVHDGYCCEFFDDFEGTSLDTNKWNTHYGGSGGSIAVGGGKVRLTSPGTWGENTAIISKSSFDVNTVWEYTLSEQVQHSVYKGLSFPRGGWDTTYWRFIGKQGTDHPSSVPTHVHSRLSRGNGGGTTITEDDVYYSDTDVKVSLKRDETGAVVHNYWDSQGYTLDQWVFGPDITLPTTFAFFSRCNEGYQGWLDVHSVKVRKYADLEPIVSFAPTELPDLTLSPDSWDFGSVTEGSRPQQTFTITNDGTADLVINDITTSCSYISISDISLPATITPGSSETFTATIDTTGLSGEISETITIHSNDPDEGTVDISGEVGLPDLTVSRDDISFTCDGLLRAGVEGMVDVDIHNEGNAAATDITVRFFDADTQLEKDVKIPSISAGDVGHAWTDWTLGERNYIYVIIDPPDIDHPSGKIPESREDNNIDYISIVLTGFYPPEDGFAFQNPGIAEVGDYKFGAHCLGMSITSRSYFLDDSKSMPPPGDPCNDPEGMPHVTCETGRLIRWNTLIHQLEALDEDTNSRIDYGRNPCQAEVEYSMLLPSIHNNIPEVLILPKHAVLAVGIEEIRKNQIAILIYDPNYPNSLDRIYLDWSDHENCFVMRPDQSYARFAIFEAIMAVSQVPQVAGVAVFSPVDLALEDPDGLVISRELNEITDAAYVDSEDLNDDGDLDDLIVISDLKLGYYTITVTPEPDAEPTDTYTLEVSAGDTTIVLAENVPIGEILPDLPYVIESTEEGIFQKIEDTTPPTIESVTLDAYTTIPAATVHVTVEATDNVGVTSVTADGVALVETGSIWEGDITAPSTTGEYTLTITAKDAADNTAETTVDYSVVTPVGGLGVAVLPKRSSIPAGSTLSLDIKVVSTENFDDVIHVYLTTEGMPPDYQADLSWFTWTDKTVQIPAGGEIMLPVEVTPTDVSGSKYFYAKAESTKWNSDATDWGKITVT